MQYVKLYVKQNKKQLIDIFNSVGATDDQLQATKVFSFLQSAFNTQQIHFTQNGKNIFTLQQYEQKMQSIVEDYYKSTQQGKQGKFYMYRVKFTFKQIIDLIGFLLQKEQTIQVIYKGSAVNNKDQANNQNIKQEENVPAQQNNSEKLQETDDNEFMPDVKQIPAIIAKYNEEILKYQSTIQTQELNQKQIKQLKDKIKQLQTKIKFLEDRLANFNRQNNKNIIDDNNGLKRKKNNFQLQIKRAEMAEEQNGSLSPRKSTVASLSPAKIQNTLKSIFQFYAKQLHVTGVKASFERIQHQSNRINYQKLVHFLKEYKIFPENSKDQKKLHQFYVKCSSNTRDLTYQGFMSLLQKLAQITISSEHENKTKLELLKLRIIDQRKKNKILMNPFHSLEKQDFRIDKASLKYQFKLIPLNGKDSDQIINELQNRRQFKHQLKQQKNRTQMIKKIRHLKKLQSIDPFHPEVQKNKHFLRQKSVMQSQPVVSLDNIQMYRDKNFDIKQMFGIQIDDNLHGKSIILGDDSNSPVKNGGYLVNNKGYQGKNRIKQIERLETDKMKNLMSGLIQRSNVKLQKFAISPSKKSSLY